MKTLLLLIPFALSLCSCKTRQVTLPDGVKLTEASWGGKEYVYYKNNPTGVKGAGVTYIHRDDHDMSFGQAMDATTTIAGGLIYAGVEKAADAGRTAVSLGAQKHATKQAGINAALEAERLKAGLETTRILNPAP